MPWTPIPEFTDGEPVRATHMQALWDNMQELLYPVLEYNRSQTKLSATQLGTTSSTWSNVSNSELIVTIPVDGDSPSDLVNTRDVLVTANVVCWASASDTVGAVDLAVDGVRVSTSGYYISWMDQPNLTPLFFVVRGLTAGAHTFSLQHRRTSGTGAINTAIFSAHWFYVQEV